MTDQETPVSIEVDEDTGDRFLVDSTGEGLRVDLHFHGEELWMSQAQISQLFAKDRTSITKHIQNIFQDEELTEETSVQKVHKSMGRPTTLYNLDMVISVGYRVSSKQATIFRKWATQTLVQFATKGFVVDAIRLKNPENADRVRELREIIKDIRSDEANIYRELQRICSLCADFFRKMQAKLV